MSDEQPAIRAHYAKVALKRSRAIPGGKGSLIRERVGEAATASVRKASSLDWIPVRLTLDICDAILTVLGEEGARNFWAELMFDSYDRGLLKPLTAIARDGIEGTNGPAALLKMAPRAWALSSRGCGEIKLVTRPGASELELSSESLLPVIIRSRGFHCVFWGACRAMLDQFRTPGTVEVTRESDGETERLIYRVEMS